MNDGRYSTFIDMKKMKENGLICDEKALIHQRQSKHPTPILLV